MRALLIISSYVGKNISKVQAERDAVRNTFLKSIKKFPELDYKFFVGDGTPTGEDETALWDTISAPYTDPEYKNKAIAYKTNEVLSYSPREDEIVLHTPDDYIHVSHKLREEHRWAVAHGYDFSFQSSADIYIDLERLMNSGFEVHDYVGRSIYGGIYPNCEQYAGGHVGYWLSRRASECIAKAPANFWCDDIWTGQQMFLNKIPLVSDERYGGRAWFTSALTGDPLPNNDTISTHLGDRNGIFSGYDPKLMYEVHAARFSAASIPSKRWLRRTYGLN